MTYYDHATQLACRIGRWAQSDGPWHDGRGYEAELELAEARQALEATTTSATKPGLGTLLRKLFNVRTRRK